MGTEELTELLEADYDDISNVEHVEDDELTILEQETTVARYEADAMFEGQELPVYIHISESVETSNDHLVTIGVYPQQVRQQEDPNIEALMTGVIEEADETADDAEDNRDDADDADDEPAEDGSLPEDEDTVDELPEDENLSDDLPDGVDVDISLS
ncbi:uncharacterized protein NP_2888A [Natronomonas pharaonis DSM 2160]|uniref:Uncharacterized protein n=1 Tax=Natronomonas pharaonis (strain ATCC 35678 / DSM 2160 / CIP 103997 / JCM 8858 / NBRC 14720 / NCIMB 2260 / Gabara) TaxID=348780 RepID=A0A1U7EWQ6_NATPD|nr:DUF6517 family protein [Natronomonas pharaonis]CAI49535.1 uncharacterized protein NP_2888A [Natronomonas pharaonis DSM 2160]